MPAMSPQFITDSFGKKISVVLPLEEFNALLAELEELQDIKLYDESKKSDEPSIPIDEAFKMIEAKRNSKR